jgi:predicted transposase/invertase (TIGR01784 family)
VLPRRRSSQKKNPFSHHPGLLPFAVLSNTDDPEQTIKKILRSEIMRESVIDQDILEEGEEKGLQKGKEEKARQIALKMLSAGFSIPEIARFTDLSPATIEQLQRQQRN